jgi:hypothetical protein
MAYAKEVIYFASDPVNGGGAVCNQKTSKFFVSHREKSMAGHRSVRRVY